MREALYAEYFMQNPGLDEAQLESRLPGEISIISDTQWHHPYGRTQRGTKEPFDESKSEKAGLKLNTQKTKFMASSPFTIMFQQIYVETMETEKDFIIFGSQITTDVDCSHEIKRCLLLERKAMRD